MMENKQHNNDNLIILCACYEALIDKRSGKEKAGWPWEQGIK